MRELLKELKDLNICLVTGSYADGTNNYYSDIDFFVKTPKENLMYGGRNRNFDLIKKLLDKHGVKYYGMTCGLSTIKECGELSDGKIELEFSDVFRKRKNKLKKVDIFGLSFGTW